GTGELVKAALDHGVTKIILGIGGSATNDGGAGMIEALGGVFYSNAYRTIDRGGGQLLDLVDIDTTHIDSRLNHVEFIVASDVDNPLLGPDGASVVLVRKRVQMRRWLRNWIMHCVIIIVYSKK